MSLPTLLYGVGATKAGTSWLYRYLHDRDDCGLKAVKELHYWDTFDAEARRKQVAAYERRLTGFVEQRAKAEAARQGWKVRNMERRMADMSGLLDVLDGDREGDRAYVAYLREGAEGAALVADITPNYGLLDVETLGRMVALSPEARVLFLMRDPVERLWSHVRMQAVRQRQPGEEVAVKAGRILNRIIKHGKEVHIPERGDYPEIMGRLDRAVPGERLMAAFIEDVWAGPGVGRICAFLGLPERASDHAPVHEGQEVPLSAADRQRAAEFLAPQYDWAKVRFGRLPDAWARHMEMV